MGYISTLSSVKLKNIDIIISEMKKRGLTNKFSQAGILAVMSKESNFETLVERGYGTTSADRIKSIFGSKVSGLSNSEIDTLKKDERAFFNKIYGKRYGNDGHTSSGYKEEWTKPYADGNDGYRYRGRGFNQITFKGNYKSAGDRIGVDLLKRPDKLETPEIAAAAAVSYFQSTFNKGYKSTQQNAYSSPDINGFKDITNATLAMYNANAGFAKGPYKANDTTSTGGLQKALSRCDDFLTYVKTK